MNKFKNINNKKIIIHILTIISVISLLCFWQKFKYNKLINNFKNKFSNYEYIEANNILLTNELNNPFRLINLNKDLTEYFNSELSKISEAINNNNDSPENILWELNEINRYNIIPFDKLTDISNSSPYLKNSISDYNNGIECFSDGNYIDSLSYFSKVSYLDLNYTSSLKYCNKAREQIKRNIFEYCDELSEHDYYSKAISILDENKDLIKNDSDVKNKVDEIKDKQQAYFDKNSELVEASSLALTNDITTDNINTLNIQSNTEYFINVNINTQKTYIYKGSKNNWLLLKVCPCSTGISGEETPTGSFTTLEKGDWFFSSKYNQGGKYWTQIVGDILFHSVPFDKDKTTVVDYTLNKPASHGCIRLSISDSKWIYNNIPKGSKVIIK